MLGGDVEVGIAILREYIKGTVGFEKLGAATGTSPKSPMHIFRPEREHRALWHFLAFYAIHGTMVT
jgi:hypothetical protein